MHTMIRALCVSITLIAREGAAGTNLSSLSPQQLVEQEKKCSLGDADACMTVALERSLSANPDQVVSAISLYARLCKDERPDACQAAGGLYASDALGRQVERAKPFFQRAQRSYERQCAANDGQGCANLVEMVDADQTSERHQRAKWDAKARRLLHRACVDGDGEACMQLAVYCERREDAQCRMEALRRACDWSVQQACELVEAQLRGQDGIAIDGRLRE